MGAQTNESKESLPWRVLKFGGTSVATAESWAQIAEQVRLLEGTARVWIVASALSQVSNRLEQAVSESLQGHSMNSFVWIRDTHDDLARAIGLSEAECLPVRELLEELRRLLEGIGMTREASPPLHE